MILLRSLKRKSKDIFAPVVMFMIFGYFFYHLIQGDRGLLSWKFISMELRKSEALLSTLTKEKELLERDIKLLNSLHLDLDMLDERARGVLGYLHSNELVVKEH